jgi:hypothetical protein
MNSNKYNVNSDMNFASRSICPVKTNEITLTHFQTHNYVVSC